MIEIYNKASASLESRRVPDPFPYSFNSQGKLILNYTGEVFEEAIERDTYLGQAEFAGFQKVQKWLFENDTGEIAWLSPPYPDIYQAAKIIVYSHDFGVATVLDNLKSEDCLSYARELGIEANSLEEIRTNPIPLGNKNWLDILGKYTGTSKEKAMISSGFYLTEKTRAISQPIWGSMPLRCSIRGMTGFQAMYESTYIGPTFDCPKCKEPIPSGKGITTCPHCGVRKEDYGESCD